jgi:hypothetical protein
MPQAVKSNKQQHDNPYHHPVVPQLRGSFRCPVGLFKDLLKSKQIQEFDQCHQAAEWAQSFCADTVWRGSRAFTWLRSRLLKPFSNTLFRVIMFMSFNHLGDLLSNGFFLPNPIIIGTSDGFLLFNPVSVQNSGINNITVKDAVDTICQIARLKQFQTTHESKRALEDLALAAEVEAFLIDVKPSAEVCTEDGFVSLKTTSLPGQESDLVKKIGDIMKMIPAVKGIEVVTEKHPNER